jgi:carbamoyl-phosphate synthase large subunit
MASTGEVGCIGTDLDDAFMKAMLSGAIKSPKNVLLSTGPLQDKIELWTARKNWLPWGMNFSPPVAPPLPDKQRPRLYSPGLAPGKRPNPISPRSSGPAVRFGDKYSEEQRGKGTQERLFDPEAAVDFNIPRFTNIKGGQAQSSTRWRVTKPRL